MLLNSRLVTPRPKMLSPLYRSSFSTKRLAQVRQENATVNLKGHNALVVGGTSGIGEGVARRLACAKVAVTIAGRNAERGKAIVSELSALSDDKDVQHKFLSCDSLLNSRIQEFCTEYAKSTSQLDFLVLTQGIATTQGRTETSEGIDQKLQLHYFGRMHFIQQLLPLLRQSARGARVLSVFSAGVHQSYPDYRNDFELKHNYTLSRAANAPGMYTDLCLDAFSMQSDNLRISFIHSAPGVVSTNWGKEMPWFLKPVIKVAMKYLGKTIDDAGELMSDALLSNNLQPGFYLLNEHGLPTKKTDLHTPEARDVVWQQTQEVLASCRK